MDSTLISIGNIDIKWYSILILIGIVLAICLIINEGKRFKFNTDFLFNLSFWTIIFGFIGARLYFVVFEFHLFENNLLSIFKIWEGGLAIHGGVLFGAITMLIYCKKYNARLTKVFDMVVPGLLLAQAIGRWGNFFNQEAYGSVTTRAALEGFHIPEFIIDGMYINNNYYHPTFLYESLLCLLCFLIIIIIRRFKYIKVGQITAIYLMWYGVVRFFIESLRTDSLMFGGFKVAQIISILMFILGLGITMISSRKSKFEDLYNSEDDVVYF